MTKEVESNAKVVKGVEEPIEFTIGDVKIVLTKAIVEKDVCGDETISDANYAFFANLCRQHKLNPFTKEAWIYVQHYKNGTEKTCVLIGKDGYFKMADSNPNYDGMQDGILYTTKSGELVAREGCLVPPECELYGGWAKVYSKNRKYPKYVEVALKEFKGSDLSLWGSKPAIMINKVAKCSALRDAFPQTFDGTYGEEEINEEKEKENESTATTTKSKAEEKIQKQKELVTAGGTVAAPAAPAKETASMSLKDAMEHKMVQAPATFKGKPMSYFISKPEALNKNLTKEKGIEYLKNFALKGTGNDKIAAQVLLTAYEKGDKTVFTAVEA